MAVAPSATGTAAYNASATTQNFNFTVNVGDTLAVFFIAQDATQSITSVTWDQGGTNQACTLVASKSCVTATNGAIYKYAVVNPTAGAKQLRVVNGTATGTSAEMQSYTGTVSSSVAAACTNALTAAANAGGSGTNVGTAAQSGVTGDMYVSAYVTNSTFSSVSDTSIDATAGVLSPAGNDAAYNRFASLGATHALTVHLGATANWAAVSCNIVAAGAATLVASWYSPFDEPKRLKAAPAGFTELQTNIATMAPLANHHPPLFDVVALLKKQTGFADLEVPPAAPLKHFPALFEQPARLFKPQPGFADIETNIATIAQPVRPLPGFESPPRLLARPLGFTDGPVPQAAATVAAVTFSAFDAVARQRMPRREDWGSGPIIVPAVTTQPVTFAPFDQPSRFRPPSDWQQHQLPKLVAQAPPVFALAPDFAPASRLLSLKVLETGFAYAPQVIVQVSPAVTLIHDHPLIVTMGKLLSR